MFIFFLFYKLVVIYHSYVHGADKIEKQLIKKLLGNYDRRVRPGLNSSTPLNVTFGLSLAQLIDVVRSKRYMSEPSCMQIRIHTQKYWHVKIIFNFATEKRSRDNILAANRQRFDQEVTLLH